MGVALIVKHMFRPSKMAGGYDLVKVGRKRKKQTKEEQFEKAEKRAKEKLGSEEIDKMKQEFGKISETERDGMITTLIAAGLSQLEIKAVLGVGGYRVARLQKRSKLTEEELEQNMERAPPSHACNDTDREAVRNSIHNYDIEPGYPCAHRVTLTYFADLTID